MKKLIISLFLVALFGVGIVLNLSVTSGYDAPQLCEDIVGDSFEVGEDFECAVEIGYDTLSVVRGGSTVQLLSDNFADGSLDIVSYDSYFSWQEVVHVDNEVTFANMAGDHDISEYGDADYIDLTFHVYDDVVFDVNVIVTYDGAEEDIVSHSGEESGSVFINVENNTGGCGDGFCDWETEDPDSCFEDCGI